VQQRYDLSEFGPKEKQKEKLKYDLSEFGNSNQQQQIPAQPQQPQEQNVQQPMIDTFLGKMQPNNPMYQIGSPEQKELISEMIASGIGMPGMNVVGQGVNNFGIIGKGVSGFGKGIKNLLTRKNPKELTAAVQKGHDVESKQISDIYNLIKSEVGPRGVGKIEIPEGIFHEIKKGKMLPNTEDFIKLLEKAKSGDYEALHQLQSDLYKKGTQALGSKFQANINKGEEILSVRNKINEIIRNKFKEHGHEDLAKLLDEASGRFKNLKETYFSHPQIAKLVHEKTRKIPKNPMNVFSEESKQMQRLLEKHPEITKELEKHKGAKDFMKKLKLGKNIGIGGGVAGGTLYGGTKLLDYLLKGS
jgi:hypothetical protein